MLKFDIRNKLKLEGKDSSNSQKSEEDTENTLKNEMISSILKSSNPAENDAPVTFADVGADGLEDPIKPQVEQKLTQAVEEKVEIKQESIQKPEIKPIAKVQPPSQNQKEIGPETSKISQLIRAIEESTEKMIAPDIDFSLGSIKYPILEQIGEKEENSEFLEKLASPSFDILEKVTYERLAVCPEHPDSMAINIRLYCPKCSSMNITKLHLIEHRRCGYISENKNYEIAADGTITKCPSCKKDIKDMKKEIVMPAMWYTCDDCIEKFDDVLIKLHCRKQNHDFDSNQSHTVVVSGYRLKNLADTANSSISPILNDVKQSLISHGFTAEENYNVTGHSGNRHRINIYGTDEHKRSVFIFIKNPNGESDNSELNTKIIQVLDTNPSLAILIGFPSISEKAKAITSNYNIMLINEQDPQKILGSINQILDGKVPPIES